MRCLRERNNKHYQLNAKLLPEDKKFLAPVQVSSRYGEAGLLLISVLLKLWNSGWQQHTLKYVKAHALPPASEP